MAASYTPVGLLVLDGTARWIVLGSVWGGCLAGVALSVAWVTAPRVLFALTYVALGWVIVIAFPQLTAELELAAAGPARRRRAAVHGRRRHLRPAPAEPVAEHVRLPRDLPRAGRRRRRHPLRGDGRLGDSRRLTSISSRSPPSWSTCRVVWSIPNSSCRIRSSERRTSWQSVSRPTSTCADSDGKPEVTSQMCRSWTSVTPASAGHPQADRLRVEPARRGLQEHAAGLAQQAVGGAQHQRGDEQGGDAVRALEAGEQDHGAGDRRGHEGREVGEDVLEGALDVERVAVRARQHHAWRRGSRPRRPAPRSARRRPRPGAGRSAAGCSRRRTAGRARAASCR